VTELASKSQLRMSFLRIALFTVPATVLLGTLSGILSNSGYSNAWFRSLDLPDFMPPAWAFPVAWTILYICLGLSLAMLIHARGAPGRGRLIGLFLVQLALNCSWSPVFFGMRDAPTGLYLIGAMIVLTVALIVLLMRVRRAAALLLVPYLAWLCFAAALNYRVVVNNPQVAPTGRSTDIPLG
jgi:translocator protein